MKVIRRTLAEIYAMGTLPQALKIDNHVISVIYFRAGYTPNDYPLPAHWDARLQLEKTNAIKCPSIAAHLAGCKKVQQKLGQPDVLER